MGPRASPVLVLPNMGTASTTLEKRIAKLADLAEWRPGSPKCIAFAAGCVLDVTAAAVFNPAPYTVWVLTRAPVRARAEVRAAVDDAVPAGVAVRFLWWSDAS
jgi:hypothetical protein